MLKTSARGNHRHRESIIIIFRIEWKIKVLMGERASKREIIIGRERENSKRLRSNLKIESGFDLSTN